MTGNRMGDFLKPSEINAFAQTCKAHQTILNKISLQDKSLYAYADHPYRKRSDYKKIERDVFCVYRNPQSYQTINLRKETYVNTSHWSFKLIKIVALGVLILGSLGCVFIAKSMRIWWRSAIDSFRNRCVVYIKITNKVDIKSFYKAQDAINPLTIDRMGEFLKPSEINVFAQTCKAHQTILKKINVCAKSFHAIEKAARILVKYQLNPKNKEILDGWEELISMIQPEDIRKKFVIGFESRYRDNSIQANEYVGNLGYLLGLLQSDHKSDKIYTKLRLPILKIEEKSVADSSLKGYSVSSCSSWKTSKTMFSFDIQISHFLP